MWVRAVRLLLVAVAVATPAAAQDSTEAQRPAPLVPLYVSQVTLHALDVHSTLWALDQGHREANPLFRDGAPGKMIAAKVASSAVTIWLAEKLWKKNRVASVAVMTGVNVALAAVVANNYRLATSQTRN